LDQGVQAVRLELWVELSGQAHRAQDVCIEPHANPTAFGFQEPVVESGVVRHEQAVVQALQDAGQQGFKWWGVPNHGVGDPGQRLNVGWNGATGMDERGPFLDHLFVVDQDHADFGDAVDRGRNARGFKIDKGESG
jgi:hypothetical protein